MEEFRDIIYYEADARDRLISGINKLADAVKVTLGPLGKTVIIGKQAGAPVVTKDGVTVAEAVTLIDPIENMGSELVKQASSRTVKAVGDGTTTATVIAQALINVKEDIKNVTEFRRGMESATSDVITFLKSNLQECDKDKSLLKSIALTSANGDEDIAEIVSSCAIHTGKEGIIEVLETDGPDTSYKITDGYKLERGFANSGFVNSHDRGVSVYADCIVLTIKDKVTNFKDIKKLLVHTKEAGKGLVIIAKEFDGEFIDTCATNMAMGLYIMPIVAPDFGNNGIYTLEDIATYCGSTVSTIAEVAMGSDTVRTGMISHITATREYTILRNTEVGDLKEVSKRIKLLNVLIGEAQNAEDIKRIKRRISQLSASTAIIRVGGHTTAETKERFDRYEDAVGAVNAALEGGVLPGGGVALYKAGINLIRDIDATKSKDFILGECNLLNSIASPLDQILSNADYEGKMSLIFQNTKDKFQRGVDARTGKFVDMLDEGIIDPYMVTVSALNNAVSIANMVLTTGCVIESPIVQM